MSPVLWNIRTDNPSWMPIDAAGTSTTGALYASQVASSLMMWRGLNWHMIPHA